MGKYPHWVILHNDVEYNGIFVDYVVTAKIEDGGIGSYECHGYKGVDSHPEITDINIKIVGAYDDNNKEVTLSASQVQDISNGFFKDEDKLYAEIWAEYDMGDKDE